MRHTFVGYMEQSMKKWANGQAVIGAKYSLFRRLRVEAIARVALFFCSVLLAMVGSSCGDVSAPEPGVVSQAISYGKEDLMHPNVGMLRSYFSDDEPAEICTGTLIGSRTVLTAAHCVRNATKVNFYLDVLTQKADGSVGRYQGTADKITAHPGYKESDYDVSNDIAVITVTPTPTVTSAYLSASQPTTGLLATLVGYGSTTSELSDQGTKRKATSVVATLEQSKVGFRAPSSEEGIGGFCLGDSGAPAFATIDGAEVQIGVHSYLFKSNQDSDTCQNQGRAMRVDAYLDWIREAAAGDITGVKTTSSSYYGDLVAPQVQILTPQEGDIVALSLNVEVQASDNIGLSRVRLLVDGMLAAIKDESPFVFAVELPFGAHTLTAVAEDVAGNIAQDEVVISSSGAVVSGNRADASSGCVVGESAFAPRRNLSTFFALLCLAWVWNRKRKGRDATTFRTA